MYDKNYPYVPVELTQLTDESKKTMFVSQWVREKCSTHYLENRGQWTACITVLIDLSEQHIYKPMAINNLIQRVLDYKEARQYIIDTYYKPSHSN